MLAAGFTFLYGPILLLVVYSFNASRLVTVWGGASMRWYAALLQDAQLIASVRTSLLVALVSAVIATLNGTLAAIALVRFGHFRTRTVFAGATYVPLVMPEVSLGASQPVLFFALALERGLWTLAAALAKFTMCSLTVAV